jgi:Arc/MetJ-type ribon-helix-helix transcriptional regulator
MATTKVTITVPDNQLAQIRRRVTAKQSPSVSGFIQQAIQKSLDSDGEFRAMLADIIQETGGPPTAEERAWVRQALAPLKKKRTKRRTAA